MKAYKYISNDVSDTAVKDITIGPVYLTKQTVGKFVVKWQDP